MNDISNLTKKSYRYWFEDGLLELAVGVLFFLCGALFAWQAVSARTWAPAAVAIGLPLLIFSGSFALGRLLRYLKETLVYPRTGLVIYQRPSSAQRRQSGIVGFIVAMVTAVAVTFYQLEQWTGVIIAAGLAVTFFIIGIRVQIRRYLLIGALALLTGLFTRQWQDVSAEITGWTLLLIGVEMLLIGGLTLWHYLRNHTPPAPSSTMEV